MLMVEISENKQTTEKKMKNEKQSAAITTAACAAKVFNACCKAENIERTKSYYCLLMTYYALPSSRQNTGWNIKSKTNMLYTLCRLSI